ncbi:MAG: type II toxin-antitoxin system VapC family toxin [Vulcanimicrobiaceae bacterium]
MIVIDASVAAAWIFADERDAYAVAASEEVAARGGVVPAFWRWEMQNTLLFALRRRRIDEESLAQHLSDLQGLPLEYDFSAAFGVELALAREHALTVYDAAYLELAMRCNCRLATKDKKLREAARASGVLFVGGGP